LSKSISSFHHAPPTTPSFPPESRETYLGDQNLVTNSDAGANPLAILVQSSGADGQDLCLVEVLDGAVREEDSGRGLGLGLDALHEDTVKERRDAAERLDCGLKEHEMLAGGLGLDWIAQCDEQAEERGSVVVICCVVFTYHYD
jgi:hypothetical protein